MAAFNRRSVLVVVPAITSAALVPAFSVVVVIHYSSHLLVAVNHPQSGGPVFTLGLPTNEAPPQTTDYGPWTTDHGPKTFAGADFVWYRFEQHSSEIHKDEPHHETNPAGTTCFSAGALPLTEDSGLFLPTVSRNSDVNTAVFPPEASTFPGGVFLARFGEIVKLDLFTTRFVSSGL